MPGRLPASYGLRLRTVSAPARPERCWLPASSRPHVRAGAMDDHRSEKDIRPDASPEISLDSPHFATEMTAVRWFESGHRPCAGQCVGAMQALSRPSRLAHHLLEMATTWPKPTNAVTTTSPGCRTARQLRPSEVDHLIAAYQSGSTVYQLAERFGIHRSTVGRHLRARGVDTTPPGLDANQLARAIALYQSGYPLSNVACKLSVPQSTVREHLLAAGVEMRAARKPHRQN